MAKRNQSGHVEGRKVQRELQDREIKEKLDHIKNKILVMSGKGGVGKSSVAAYLSVALAKRGYRVGLMDVDLHGPSIPRMLGLKGNLELGKQGEKPHPVGYMPNMKVISIEVLIGENKDAATIWRGPLKIGVIRQFISDLEWGNLDYMIIDSPPGTGDEPLTVAETIPDAKALIVTTPQEISLADVRKSINFCRKVNMEILGLVENMSGLVCPYCGEMIELFKTQGGMFTAKKENLRLLASLPFEPEVVKEGDAGDMSLLDNNELLITQEFNKMVDEIVKIYEADRNLATKIKEKKMPAGGKGPGNGKMVVIPISGGKLSSHFGHGEQFIFIEIENGEVRNREMRIPPPHEPGVIPRWLHENGADVIIAGGIGERAQQLLSENGIEVIIGASVDSPEALIHQYLTNTLKTTENVCDH